MKNILSALGMLILFQSATNATTHVVTVKNFQFSPATVNAVVGDTILWNWESGSHTTTSTSVPSEAPPWDKSINSSNKTYEYKILFAGTYQYWCTPHKPEMAGTINASAALPVTLSSFSVAPAKLNAALVTWVTTAEENTAYFAVKRSNDGNNFTEIARVNATGNSTLVQRYSYTDNNTGTTDPYLYYCLDIVDKDNRKQSTVIKSFKNNAAVTKLIRSITPNPVSSPGHLMLQFYADKPGKMNARVYTTEGKIVIETTLSGDAGLNNGHIHLGNIPPGTYNIVFTLNGLKENYRVVLQ